ncbi:MAG: type II secretion system protein [Myxococcota bacterium]
MSLSAPMRRPRGYTLIEMMVAIAILAIGASLLAGTFELYQDAARRARAVVAIAEVLNIEVEAAIACPDRSCLRRLLTHTATTRAARSEADSWLRLQVQRTMQAGPDDTLQYEVSASVPNLLPPRKLVILLEKRP